jgi:elongation factor Ts
MAKISAALVKQLRDKTGAGMGDCKKALVETEGDVEAAVDVLRSKGIKASQLTRETAEGAIRLHVADDAKSVAVVELRCETDFAARNDNFLKLLDLIAGAVHESAPANLDAAKEIPAIKDGIQDAAAVTIRENIQLYSAERRVLEGEGKIGSYVHHNGKVGVAVALNANASVMGQDGFDELLKDLCMHATAHQPPPAGIDRDSICPDLIERERAVALRTIEEDPKMSSKPDEIKQKMVDGKLRKFSEDRPPLDQKFVKDPSLSITKLIDAKAKQLGGDIKIAWFVRQQVGV